MARRCKGAVSPLRARAALEKAAWAGRGPGRAALIWPWPLPFWPLSLPSMLVLGEDERGGLPGPRPGPWTACARAGAAHRWYRSPSASSATSTMARAMACVASGGGGRALWPDSASALCLSTSRPQALESQWRAAMGSRTPARSDVGPEGAGPGHAVAVSLPPAAAGSALSFRPRLRP